MTELYELLTDNLINADIEDMISIDRNYRYNNTNLGNDFADYEEYCEWYNQFCYDWYKTCKSIAKLLKV